MKVSWGFHPGFATGLLWLTAESAKSAELLGHLAKNDPVYSGRLGGLG